MDLRKRSDVLHVGGVVQIEFFESLSQTSTLQVKTSRVSSDFAEAN